MSVYTDSTGLWNYTLNGGNATIGDGSWNGGSATTLGTSLSGAITIPCWRLSENFTKGHCQSH